MKRTKGIRFKEWTKSISKNLWRAEYEDTQEEAEELHGKEEKTAIRNRKIGQAVEETEVKRGQLLTEWYY